MYVYDITGIKGVYGDANTYLCICIHTYLHTYWHNHLHTFIHTDIHTYTMCMCICGVLERCIPNGSGSGLYMDIILHINTTGV